MRQQEKSVHFCVTGSTVNFDEMGHLKYKTYGRAKSGNCRLEGHSTLFGINVVLATTFCSTVMVSKFHGPRVK